MTSASANGDGFVMLPDQPWRQAPETREVMAALGVARFVGGCVRDALLDRPVKDIDIATPLTPPDVSERLAAAGLKAIPTGLAHGTVTAVTHGMSFEITTLRRDVETDGRHAVVAFTDDWQADAARRDFTMNALYADLDGRLFDFFGGIDDARAGRVRFVGDPATRLTEDVLRLLRFFRFHAHYGQGAPDTAGLMACIAAAPRLPTLSGERIRDELLKLLTAPAADVTVALMVGHGLLSELLPVYLDVRRLESLVAIERGLGETDPVRRLGSLLPDSAAARMIAMQLRLSNEQTARLVDMTSLADAPDLATPPRHLHRLIYAHGAERTIDHLLLGLARNTGPGTADITDIGTRLSDIRTWIVPTLPIKGRDLIDMGVAPGPRMGTVLKALEAWWCDRDFTDDRQSCLYRARTILTELEGTTGAHDR